MAESSWRDEYPFASHFLSVPGQVRMHYVDEGAGRPLLMVHGNPTWSFYWRNIIREFRGEYRCIAVDHLGCGLSDKPQQYQYTLDEHIENLVQLVETMDLEGATLLAHDWGGAIGLGALLRLSHRFERVVLFNTAAYPPPFVPLRIRACRIPFLGQWAIRGLNLFARAATTMAVETPLMPTTCEGLLAPYDSWANRVAIWGFVRDIPFTSRHPTWKTLEQIERGLKELQMPVDLIWGMKDWCFDTRCLQRFQEIWPHANTHPLPEAGHYVVEDAAKPIAEILRTCLAPVSPAPEIDGPEIA